MKIILFGKEHSEKSVELAKSLFAVLNEKKIPFLVDEGFYLSLQRQNIVLDEGTKCTSADFDANIAISIGGDGTFLKAADKIGSKNIPILGVNTGRLGFLTNVSKGEFAKAITALLNNRYVTEERAMLQFYSEDDAENVGFALNEIAVLKQDGSSMISLHTTVNGEYLATYQADGLIVATPTGSTAYSMSVGGPLVVPQAKNLILSPIAPHSLTVRPLVIPDDWTIELQVESRNNAFLVALDGRSKVFHQTPKLFIKKADFTIKLVKLPAQTFYKTLRSKLMWGIDKRIQEC